MASADSAREGLVYASSTVADGNMHFEWGPADEVVRNREAFLGAHGLALDDAVVMQVMHSDGITLIDEGFRGRGARDLASAIRTEALLTTQKGLVLFLLTADCFPIAYHDPRRGAIALAHLGWRPTDKHLAEKVVAQMAGAFGTDPRDLRVFMGPGIHKESYVLRDTEQKQSPAWQPFLKDLPTGETSVDLIGFNRAQLAAAGVPTEQITVDSRDTAATPSLFSHYRAVRTGEPEGRFATILALK